MAAAGAVPTPSSAPKRTIAQIKEERSRAIRERVAQAAGNTETIIRIAKRLQSIITLAQKRDLETKAEMNSGRKLTEEQKNAYNEMRDKFAQELVVLMLQSINLAKSNYNILYNYERHGGLNTHAELIKLANYEIVETKRNIAAAHEILSKQDSESDTAKRAFIDYMENTIFKEYAIVIRKMLRDEPEAEIYNRMLQLAGTDLDTESRVRILKSELEALGRREGVTEALKIYQNILISVVSNVGILQQISEYATMLPDNVIPLRIKLATPDTNE
jgi:hypothetical protein